jgi:hypothetical protein
METSTITIKDVNLSSRRRRAGFLNSRTPACPREKLAPSNRSLLSTVSSLPVPTFPREIPAEERCIGLRQRSVLGLRWVRRTRSFRRQSIAHRRCPPGLRRLNSLQFAVERAAPGMDEEVPGAALHTWGLGSRP